MALSLSKLTPHHMALKVKDLSLCENFYCEVLGLDLLAYQEDDTKERRSVWLQISSTILMLEKSTDDKPALSELGWNLFALAIPANKRLEWKEYLKSCGVTIERESAYSLFFRDPEGNRLALSHYPEVR